MNSIQSGLICAGHTKQRYKECVDEIFVHVIFLSGTARDSWSLWGGKVQPGECNFSLRIARKLREKVACQPVLRFRDFKCIKNSMVKGELGLRQSLLPFNIRRQTMLW